MPRNSHRQRIHDMIRARLLAGGIGPEDRLVDHAIAAEIGVSRMPVREALLQLTHEGYLESTSRGFALPQLSPLRVAETFTLRRLLEPHAAALATQARNAQALQRMAEALATLRAAGDVAGFHRAAETFRNAWIAAIPNAELRGAIQRYSAQVQQVRFATMSSAAARTTIVDGLAALLAAFEAGDALAAADRMLRFVHEAEAAHASHAAASAPQGEPDDRDQSRNPPSHPTAAR